MRRKIAITLDRERFLRLDMNAMCEFEELTGNSLFNIGNKMNEAKSLRALLFVALKSAGEEITIEEVGSMIDFQNFSMISEVLTKLMDHSYGKTDEETEKK